MIKFPIYIGQLPQENLCKLIELAMITLSLTKYINKKHRFFNAKTVTQALKKF